MKARMLILFPLFMALAAEASAPAGRVAEAKSPPPASLLARGDDAFKQRAHSDRAREALKIYRDAVAATGRKDPEALWRLSMACYFVGIRLTDKHDEKKEIYAEGRDAGLESADLSPKCAACHFWASINMALYGDTVGAFKMLFTLRSIQDHLKASLEADPGYANGGAYRLLGLIQQKLPGILGGSNSRAKDYFEKAIAVAPGEPLNYLFMADLLRQDLDQPEKAREFALKGIAIQGIAPDRLESIDAQAELRQKYSIAAPREVASH